MFKLSVPPRTQRKKFEALRNEVAACRRCPRLVKFREGVKPRASYAGQTYWRKPVPGFGDVHARLLILGLSPAAHGGNRTGRVFTGDESGRFLVKALHRAGFANQPTSEGLEDGLIYTDCYVTAAVKCAPPDDKPTAKEFESCAPFLEREFELLTEVQAVLALGKLAFDACLTEARRRGATTRGVRFAHGASYSIQGMPRFWASYHPSPRNTNTGVLTQRMLAEVFRKVKKGLHPRIVK